ncbi:MAG: hypothetical protein A2Z04_07825 [Chloroflexi bacterium RBG_16_57_9]|nr:MAG: hypothetical protein A2Z04_07825 [Chloroflexi bacterium RBG_16_57_9]
MPVLKFMKDNMPHSSEEFRQALREVLENASPVDDFVAIVKNLTILEQGYGMDSADFYARFQRGEMGDAMEFMRWATKYEMYREMKEDLSETLDLLEQYALPAGR